MALRQRMKEGTINVIELAALVGCCELTARKYLRTGQLNLTPLSTFDEQRFNIEDVKKAIATFKPPRMGRPPKVAKRTK